MKIKKIIALVLVVILANSNLVFAINEKEEKIELPNEKPVINIKEENETDNRINKEKLEKNKRSNIEKTVNTKSTKRMLKATKTEDKYQGEQVPGRNDLCDTFVSRDGKNYTYTIDITDTTRVAIYRYCFETKETTQIYTNNNITIPDFYFPIQNNIYVKGATIYFVAFSKTDEKHLQIFGYDAQTEKIVYSNTFEISRENYDNSFCVDKNKNICIVTRTENMPKISFYDKNGALISESKQKMFSGFYSLKTIYMNSNIIWAKAFIENNGWLTATDISLGLENGIIVEQYNNEENYGMEFNFLNDEETMAYDQYGDIIQFQSYASSVQTTILKQIKIGTQTISMNGKNSFNDNYIYAGGDNGIIIEYNWKNYELKRIMSIGKDKVIIGVFKSTDKLCIEYTDSNWNNVYALVIDYSDFETPSQIVEITNHTTLNRTKDEIKAKYNELEIINKNNLKNANDEIPSIKAPYSAGSLNEQTKTDTLNQINYFRWLAGVNEVTIDEKYLEHAQCGAVLLTTCAQLMHKPPQPPDMTDEFYKKALGATSANIGVSMSANISKGCAMAESIKQYVDDVYNIEPNVGHRLSIIDHRATATSFGYAEKSGVVDMLLDWKATKTDDFTAWPSAGSFPIESINKNAAWSIGIDTSKYFTTNDVKLKIKANGKEYSSDNNDFTLNFDNSYKSYYYNLPNEVINYLTDGKDNIQENKKVEIELSGLGDFSGNTCIIKYPIQFISLDGITYQKGDVNGDGKITLIDYGLVLAHVKRTKILTGEEFARADVSADEKVTLIDYGLILAHVKRTKLLV